MHKYFKPVVVMISIITIFAILMPLSLSAQDGRWVQHSLSGLGTGAAMYARGDGLLVYTLSNADKFIIFDIQTGEWLEINLGAAQVFKDVETEGDIVFAYTDNLVIGYSALTMTWDTMTYSGDYVAGTLYYYGVGKNLAYFLTKSYLYVFDAELGSWHSFDYGLEPDQTASTPWVRDDYIGMVLSNPYPEQPGNVVYSMHTHSFNKTVTGAHKSSPLMDHGFVGLFNLGYDGKTYILIGYSALTNTFSFANYTCGDDEAMVSGTGAGAMPADEFTANVYGFRHVVPNTSVTANWYGFDTRRGSWDHITHVFDWDDDHYYGDWHQCGQFAFDQSLYTADGSYHLFFYDGSSGTFRDFSPGLIYKSTTSGFRGGGSVFGIFDTLSAWGYNVVGDMGSMVSLALDETTNFYLGEDFASLTRWSTTADTMITYFYNGNTNNWSSAAVPEHSTTDGNYTEHMFLWCGGTEYEAIFYSSYLDEIFEYDFPDGISVSRQIRESLAYVKSSEKLILFNGLSGQHHEFDFEINGLDLGTNSMIFFDTTSKTLYGYNTLSENWTTHTIDLRPYTCNDSGYIGLISESSEYLNYVEFCAYNGLADSWVELIPNGSHIGFLVGEKTAIVVRTADVYAFDPQRTAVDVSDDNRDILPSGCGLAQNYPNPFNPSTVIEYTLPRRDHVELTIYNLLGRRVRTLLDQIQDAGQYKVTWNGRDDAGIMAGSGLYFYQVKSGEFSVSKKMLMIK